jgi:hypothetical protein
MRFDRIDPGQFWRFSWSEFLQEFSRPGLVFVSRITLRSTQFQGPI